MNKKILHTIVSSLPSGVRLVAVSKFHPKEEILEAYNEGQRIFGENHVQEMVNKYMELPKDIEWHFIGHLQTNKVAKITPFVSMIHSVDSEKLLSEINKHATKSNRIISCLLQLHVAKEQTKFGFTIEECTHFLESEKWKEFKNIHISGLMCMATNTNDAPTIKEEFHKAHETFRFFKDTFFHDDDNFCECSWGMSNDYPIALTEGSTLIRIGTKIFGERNYK